MKATVTKKDGLHREMKIVVPAKELNNKVDAKVEELSKTMKVSGFRPGKVPPAVIKQRHGDAVMGEVLQDAVSECTGKAMEQENCALRCSLKSILKNSKKILTLNTLCLLTSCPRLKP